MRFRRSLALYIFGILVLLILITSVSYFYLSMTDQKEVLKIHEINKARDIGFVIQALINNEVEKLYALSKSLQNHEDLMVNIAVASVEEENAPAFSSLVERIIKELNLDLMVVTDDSGHVLYDSHAPRKRGYVPDVPRLAEVLKGKDLLEALKFGGVWHIASIVPVRVGNVQVGTLILGTRIDDEFASLFAKATDTQMSFGNSSGVLASSLPLNQRSPLSIKNMSDSLSTAGLIRQRIAGTTKVIGYLPVHVLDRDFSLAIEFDTADLVRLYAQKKRNHLIMFGLIIITSLILGTALTLRIVSPLRSLRYKAEKTVQDLTGSKPRQGKGDEVKSLVGAFNVMLDTVQNHLAERMRLEKELRQQALYDVLTGLPNRLLFLDRLRNLFEHKRRKRELLFALLFIDLDHFKNINDSLGHMAGDQLLVSVAGRLRTCTRPGDTVARFGGDEFVIILDGITSEQDAMQGAERVHQELERPFDLDGSEVYTSASIGIALSHRLYDTPEEFLRDADTAMYHAKDKGRACHVCFDQSMHHDAVENMQLGNDLRRALDREEVVLYYQPIVEIYSGNVMGFEALARWEHPVRGILLPEEFIPLAEENGLIVPLGSRIIKEACAQIRSWQDQFPSDPPLMVSINLSAKEFNRTLVQTIEEAIAESGIEPSSLGIEITESLIMADSSLASEVLDKLKELKVQVYLDDFGTGYSSLNYIHKFPLNVLKMDRTFVNNILHDAQAQEIVKAIITLAQRLDLRIIIEGIENLQQLELFRGFNCDLVQGYLFSEPLPAPLVPAYMKSQEIVAGRVSLS